MNRFVAQLKFPSVPDESSNPHCNYQKKEKRKNRVVLNFEFLWLDWG